MKNFKLEIQYDGSRYKGWQTQKGNISTIEEKLTSILFKMTNENIKLIGCGRTDTGVHAKSYIANFTSHTTLEEEDILEYLNKYLPEDIRILDVRVCSERFHARYNATSKTYVYTIDNNRVSNVFLRRYALSLPEKLDIEKMKEASKVLIGKHDFKSFTTLKTKNKSTIRIINYIDISEEDGIIKIEFNGNGFLQRMVRMLVNVLIEAGLNKLSGADVLEILEAKDKNKAKGAALSHGLCMKEVTY